MSDLVAAADMINHAILLDHEVEAALGKLTGAGLVRVLDDWTFELTDEGTGLWAGGSRDLQAQVDSVTAELSNVQPGRTTVKLPRGAMASAIEDHHRDARG